MKSFQLLIIIFFSFSCISQTKTTVPSKINVKLPATYILEKNSEDKYNLLTASKNIDNEITALIEIKYSKDASFTYISNQNLIDEMLKTNTIETFSSILFDDFKVHSKQETILKGTGKCISFIYSGKLKSNGIRIVNVTFQFLKNNCVYTLIGSSTPEAFSGNYKEFLEIFDTLTI